MPCTLIVPVSEYSDEHYWLDAYLGMYKSWTGST